MNVVVVIKRKKVCVDQADTGLLRGNMGLRGPDLRRVEIGPVADAAHDKWQIGVTIVGADPVNEMVQVSFVGGCKASILRVRLALHPKESGDGDIVASMLCLERLCGGLHTCQE